MRPKEKLFYIAAIVVSLVFFVFLSHAHSVPSDSIHVPFSPPVNHNTPIPPFFENLTIPDSNNTETPEPDMGISRFQRMQLALARICVSEAGFQVQTNDCTLIYHALRARSRSGEISLSIMRAYSRRSFDRERTDSRRWIAHLSPTFHEPKGWSENTSLPWSVRRQGFIEVYEHAGVLLRTRPENTCGVRIDHWGAPGFRRNLHLGNGWRLVECGETLNDFWTLPQHVNRSEEVIDVEEVAAL